MFFCEGNEKHSALACCIECALVFVKLTKLTGKSNNVINSAAAFSIFSSALFRSRSLQTPANIFIINLAISDFLMSITQSPVFFTNSLHRHWIFGEKGLYIFFMRLSLSMFLS